MSKTKTIKIEGTIYMCLNGYSKGKIDFCNFPFDREAWEEPDWKSERIKLAPYTIEVEIPDGIDMHKVILTSLQEKRKLILSENQQRLNAIDVEISEHLAIENKE